MRIQTDTQRGFGFLALLSALIMTLTLAPTPQAQAATIYQGYAPALCQCWGPTSTGNQLWGSADAGVTYTWTPESDLVEICVEVWHYSVTRKTTEWVSKGCSASGGSVTVQMCPPDLACAGFTRKMRFKSVLVPYLGSIVDWH